VQDDEIEGVVDEGKEMCVDEDAPDAPDMSDEVEHSQQQMS
jgi:hypothetical protein